ncbi:MAG: histone deacetylase, partial [Pseudomonadota bacterium]
MALAIVYHEAYAARLPASHRFPMGKFKALKDVLIAEGLATEASLYRPDPIPARWLDLAHEPAYVNAALRLELPPETERRIGLPITREVVKRACFVAAGTVLTARLALERGLAANTAGGSHHARRDTGSGFCTFNDVGVAASVLLQEGQVRRV